MPLPWLRGHLSADATEVAPSSSAHPAPPQYWWELWSHRGSSHGTPRSTRQMLAVPCSPVMGGSGREVAGSGG